MHSIEIGADSDLAERAINDQTARFQSQGERLGIDDAALGEIGRRS